MKKNIIVVAAAVIVAGILVAVPITAAVHAAPSDKKATAQPGDTHFDAMITYVQQSAPAAGMKRSDVKNVTDKLEAAKNKYDKRDLDASFARLDKSSDIVGKLARKNEVNQDYYIGYQKRIAELKARLQSTPAPTPPTPAPLPNGGYPDVWANAPISSIVDSWGMYNRQPTSYAAFRVADSGRYMPYWGGRGDSKQWDENALAMGIPVDKTPQAGDVAVSNLGTYGHVMYVESVAADGSINVSDYNQQFDGLYRNYWISGPVVVSKGLVFIHFPYPTQ